MNILFLMGTYPYFGGVEVVSTILANEFIRKEYGVSLVSFDQPSWDKGPMKLDEKVKFYPLKKPTYSKKNVKRLHDILVKDNVDVLINQWVVPFFVARLCHKAMKGTKCKMIGVHHNIPNSNQRIEQARITILDNNGNFLINKFKLELITFASRLSLKYTISKCDRYLVLSPSFIPIAERYTRTRNKGKMSVLVNPLTITPNKEEKITKKKEIIYIGRIEYNQKCTYRIVDIWGKLESKHPDWCMKIVGDGPDRLDLQKRIKERNLKNISIEGFQDPLLYYKEASILLLASAYEGFPLVIAEGMEYGVVPIVYDSYAAVHDIIDDSTNGFIVPQPYSDEEFVERIEELMNNEEMLKTLSKNARLKARKYSLQSIIKQWENIFRELN